ncbi:MAG TPA: SIR2 family protein [Candidatus Acidoferrales bacterium]|nr:SIR2 family protein [Candidatus Acidoferrales bacterium]
MYALLARLAKSRRLVILCGAGISHWPPADKPLGDDLRNEILRHFNTTSGRPLEDTLSRVGWGIEFCLEKVFGDPVSKPTLWHRLIALLIKRRQLTLVMTLNFDRLIEDALDEIGLSAPTDYVSIITEASASAHPHLRFTKPAVFHLHGDYQASMMCATIPRIVDPSLAPIRLQPLTGVLRNKRLTVLVVGCSCRDDDISRLVASISRKGATIVKLKQGSGPFSCLTDCFADFTGCTFNVRSYARFIRRFAKALEIGIGWVVDSTPVTLRPYWKRHITRWADTVPPGARRLIVARLAANPCTWADPAESGIFFNVGSDRVLIVGDTLAINGRVHKGRQLWLYEHRPRSRQFLWKLERGDVVGSLHIDERHCVFDWPELIWRLRAYGYLGRTSKAIKRLRKSTIRDELCCAEEMEIASYVSHLIDIERESPLYHEQKYRASLFFARSVLTGHIFLHQVVLGNRQSMRT